MFGPSSIFLQKKKFDDKRLPLILISQCEKMANEDTRITTTTLIAQISRSPKENNQNAFTYFNSLLTLD